MSVRPKRAAEAVLALKPTGATASEATTAASLLRSVAEDIEAGLDIKAQATTVYRELLAIPGQQGREEAMQRATGLASRIT